MPTIIDGYNLIFTCGLDGKNRTPQSLEKARARLISELTAICSENERSATTIVFDAKRLRIKETLADTAVNGIRILYAVDYEDADTLIEELIAKHSTPKKLIVVSSDHRLQTAATRRKAIAVDSDVWYDELLATHEACDDQQHARNAEALSRKSLESIDWISEFGSVNIDDLSEDESEPLQDNESSPTPNPGAPNFNPFPLGYGEDLLD